MKHTINIDASSLSDSGCILRWKQVVVDGYKDLTSSASIVYGSAFHKFIDTMYQTKGDFLASKKAMAEVFNRPKNETSKASYLMDERHLLTTSLTYWEDVILRDNNFQVLELPNGKPATEVTFSIPYIETDLYQVNLCGTIDRIGQIKGGCYCIRDFKTTSKWNSREYLADYRLSKQLRFYTLALKLMTRHFPDSVLGKIGGTQVGCCIDGVFLKPKTSETAFASSDVFQFTDKAIVKFEEMLVTQIHKLLAALDKGEFPQEGIINGSCQSQYKCKFFNVCSAPEDVRTILLERDFKKVQYNPLAFGSVL